MGTWKLYLGNIWIEQPLSGALDSNIELQGNLSIIVPLSGTIDANIELEGDLTVNLPLIVYLVGSLDMNIELYGSLYKTINGGVIGCNVTTDKSITGQVTTNRVHGCRVRTNTIING